MVETHKSFDLPTSVTLSEIADCLTDYLQGGKEYTQTKANAALQINSVIEKLSKHYISRLQFAR